jgi:hypothetical protein
LKFGKEIKFRKEDLLDFGVTNFGRLLLSSEQQIIKRGRFKVKKK